jgi:3-oxoacyl-[acyl-carrier protein] reductase
VVLTYRKEVALSEKLQSEFGKERLHAVQMDLLDQNSIETAMESALESFGGFDVVVHNAGFCDDTPFFFMEANQWQSVIQASLNSFYHINKAVLPEMLANKSGRIIVLTSVSGEIGNRGQVNYSAAKGALIAASKALSKEVARKGILVNLVSPGLIETDMTSEFPLDRVRELIPVGRIGKPEEVAGVVEFLASKDASYISGAVIRVNGGLCT